MENSAGGVVPVNIDREGLADIEGQQIGVTATVKRKVRSVEVVDCPYCKHMVAARLCLICRYGAPDGCVIGEDFGVYVECSYGG